MSERSNSEWMWERLAKGDFRPEVRSWLRTRANAILMASAKPAGHPRNAAIAEAVGLKGDPDKYASLRSVIASMQAFGANRAQIVDHVHAALANGSIPVYEEPPQRFAEIPGGHPKSPSDGHFKIPQ